MDDLAEHEINQFIMNSHCECGGKIVRHLEREVVCSKCGTLYILSFSRKKVTDKFNQLIFESVHVGVGNKVLPDQLVIKERLC